jgi:hypothetical protein
MGGRAAALGNARARAPESPTEPNDVSEACTATVEGAWRVDLSLLGQAFSGCAALLSPFDQLIKGATHDRGLRVEYQLEMYKPAAKAPLGMRSG